MNSPDHIRYLQRREIDPVKWDACIAAAPNGLIYARSFYLDAMTAGQWDALVLDDYRVVMPLTWNRKFGFYYLYQPFCTPCLGIFGNGSQQTGSSPSSTDPASFLQAIPRKFRFWDIDLNEANLLSSTFSLPPSGASPGADLPSSSLSPSVPDRAGSTGLLLKTTKRVNHFLHLDKKAEALEQDYHRLARRMCKAAEAENIEIIRDIGPRDVIDLYRKEYGARHSHVKDAVYERLTACADKAFLQGHARTYLALLPDGGIAAFYLVLSDERFVYSTLGGSTAKGKEKSAFYLLTDAAIKDHADSARIFRFEGSDIPGVASFDASFGSTMIHYPHLLMNNLPFPIRLLKK
jgi:hypothetical protein